MKPDQPISVGAFRAEIAKQREAARAAAVLFVNSLRLCDAALFAESIEGLEYNPDGWALALRGAIKLADVPAKSRSMMLHLWLHAGDAIRNSVDNDPLLCDALRNVLPAYQGGPLTLFRGESSWNRKRRTYGLSWSSDRGVADSFARRPLYNGSVVLETLAPAEAILCLPLLHTEYPLHEAEAEYLVDRRQLDAVKVVKRYPAAETALKAKKR